MSKNRTLINRSNAKLSTGPQTAEGKSKSSLNALRHGLTSQVVVMPTEDLILYLDHSGSFHTEYTPQGPTETHLVQTLADCAWRLNRARALENNLLTIGLASQAHRQDQHNHHEIQDALATAAGIEARTRQLAMLSLHDARLTRQFDKTLTLLKSLQAERKAQHQADLQTASQIYLHYQNKEATAPYNPEDDGFVFSTAEIETYLFRKNRKSQAFHAGHTRAM